MAGSRPVSWGGLTLLRPPYVNLDDEASVHALHSKEFYVYTAPRDIEADGTIDRSLSWAGEHVGCE